MATRGELKHLSNPRNRKIIDSVSSGERKRNSLNPIDVKLQGVVNQVSWGSIAGDLNLRREEILFDFSRTVWKGRSKRVIAPYVKESNTSSLGTPSITR
jgi:predicted lipoprotein